MNLPLPLPPLPPEPRVSVLTPNYNVAHLLPEAVASVQAQTYANWEMIICDDASHDNSRQLLQALCSADPRLQAICLEKNAGHGGALGACFAASGGEILCFLDADDTWEPDKIAQVVAAARQTPTAGLLVHGLHLRAGDQHFDVVPYYLPAPGWHGPAMAGAGKVPPITPGSALSLRRAVAERIFPLPGLYRKYADCAINAVALALTPLALVGDRPLGELRLHGSNITSGARLQPRELRDSAHFQAEALRLAAAVSGLSGPWPPPYELTLWTALADRLELQSSWRHYRRRLRACPQWAAVGRNKRWFYEYGPLLPPAWVRALFQSPRLRRLLASRSGRASGGPVPV